MTAIMKSTHYGQAMFIPRMQELYNIQNSISVIYHIDKVKKRNQMVISIDSGKTCVQSQISFPD